MELKGRAGISANRCVDDNFPSVAESAELSGAVAHTGR